MSEGMERENPTDSEREGESIRKSERKFFE